MLDMYLYRCRKGDRTAGRTELACWRKANQIRRWFAENLEGFEDNGDTVVPREKIVELLAVCKVVSESRLPTVAKKLLPVGEGPFFGPTIYDYKYFEVVDYTISRLTNVLRLCNDDTYDIVYCEWWG